MTAQTPGNRYAIFHDTWSAPFETPPQEGARADVGGTAVHLETDKRLPVSGTSTTTMPMKDAPDLHARCSRLVERANLLSAPSHGIWRGLPNDLALDLAVQLSEIHTNALSVIAWFDDDEAKQGEGSSSLHQLKIYLAEAERFIETIAKAT